MICPKCRHKIHIRQGKSRKIQGVWRHKVCPTQKTAEKKPAA